MHVSDSSAAAATLLAHIPASARRAAVSDALDALPQAGSQDLVILSALLRREEDETLVAKAVEGLLILLQQDRVNDVVAICQTDDRIGIMVLQKVAAQLMYSFPLETARSTPSASTLGSDPTRQLGPAVAGSYLSFAAKIMSVRTPSEGVRASLLLVTLKLLGNATKALSGPAKELAFDLVVSDPDRLQAEGLPDVTAVLWSTIVDLVTADDTALCTVGYGLWLRWWKNQSTSALKSVQNSEYWNLLAQGLRVGDGEQRKCCLAILRLSVATAVNDPKVLATISSSLNKSPGTLEQQYARYCTVFETIVLGRYLNQVIECERDLDLLAAPESGIPNIWLFALLSAAMDPKFQDSNRRFIAQWIFKGKLQPFGAMTEYTALLRQHILPWATEGRLFTTSLRRVEGITVCTHGEALAEYVFVLLKSSAGDVESTEALLGTLLSFLVQKDKALFAYAGVYVLEGVYRAFQACPSMALQRDSLEIVLELSAWTGLPELAVYHFQQRCLSLCEKTLAVDNLPFERLSPQSTLRWKSLSRKSQGSGDDSDSTASVAVSQRDLNEQKSIAKCKSLQVNVSSATAEAVENTVSDLWSDVEYLEYPKKLLMVLLDTVLHRDVVQAAIYDPSKAIANALDDSTRRFHKLAESRLYLLSPLIGGVRTAVLGDPRATEIFPVEEIILRIANNPPEPTLDFQLEDATVELLQRSGDGNASYETFFGKRESIGFAALLDLGSRIKGVDSAAPKSLLETLMAPWLAQKAPVPIVTKWKTPLQVQMMLLCTEQYLDDASEEQTKQLLQDFHHILALEPLPRYRFLLEWIVARLYIRHSKLRGAILDHLATKDHHTNPKYLASLMKVASMIGLSSESSENFAKNLADALVALSASSKVIIRHEAQWSFPQLWDHATAKRWTCITENSSLASLNDYVTSLERYIEPPVDRELGKLDPVAESTLANLAEGTYLDIEPSIAPLAHHSDFLVLEADDQARGLNLESRQRCVPLGDRVRPFPQTSKRPTSDAPTTAETPSTALPDEAPSKPLALQTKGTAYLTESQSTLPKHDLHVVASLIDNPYNLGGLSRASEIFGASTLYLANPRVASNKDFTAVSVSSHLHIPLKALAAADVPAFLARKKLEGHTVVGIEQTDRSVVLGSKSALLPHEKVVLVLGSEREGIPAVVLGECDVLVEIPQQGITRSLNVQTAASIVLFELTRQRGGGE
ncbi:hypothetical protein MBLNU230_g0080t1 [Neophaeotheca triangularis]